MTGISYCVMRIAQEKTNQKIRSYRDLEIRRERIELVEYIYRLTENPSKQEICGSVTQLRPWELSTPLLWQKDPGNIIMNNTANSCMCYWEVVLS